MWFKQIQIFKLGSSIQLTNLQEKLEALTFTPCLPSMPQSIGWVAPCDEIENQLQRKINHCMLLCLQIEDKLLPATVLRHNVAEAIKQIEASENRKLRQKEKFVLKEEITLTLLPRAFSRYTKVYGYIDNNKKLLVLGTTNAKKTEQFLSLLKKTIGDDIHYFNASSASDKLTQWLKTQDGSPFSIEKSCILQDPQQESRIIRCKQQDLSATGIQAFLKDGCKVIQLALSWQDRVNFNLAKDLSLTSIQFQDEVIASANEINAETKQQQFDADFLIMSETLNHLLTELINMFMPQNAEKKTLAGEKLYA